MDLLRIRLLPRRLLVFPIKIILLDLINIFTQFSNFGFNRDHSFLFLVIELFPEKILGCHFSPVDCFVELLLLLTSGVSVDSWPHELKLIDALVKMLALLFAFGNLSLKPLPLLDMIIIIGERVFAIRHGVLIC